MEFLFLPLTDPVQVDLVAHSHNHHDADHHAESRAEDPHGLRCSAVHRADAHAIWTRAAAAGERTKQTTHMHIRGATAD